MKLLEAAGRANISVAVIHPSFEPIAEEARNKRLSNAKKNLKILNQVAKENGIVLALENLPRTCLGNTSEEMLSLLNETGAAFIFDTNHSLSEDNVSFLQNMIQHGYCPVSLWSDWCGARESASASGNANLYAGVPRIDTCYVDRTVYV